MSSPADAAAALLYREGGAGDVPLRNQEEWQRYAIVPRVLGGVTEVDLTVSVAGIATWPVLVAATAAQGLWHADAEAATAHGARRAETLMTLSQSSTLPPERVAAEGPYLQQVYLPEDRELLSPFLERVAGLGARALVLTVDQLPVPRTHDFRDAVDWAEPVWAAYDRTAPGGAPARGFSDRDVAWLVARTGLPVLVKGVLHPDDAVLAVASGACGVIVSNHGGRQLPASLTPAEALPEVRAAVGPDVAVYVDSGVREPEDVLRALCLGADAAFVGRPVLRALERGGAAGVAGYLRELRAGLESLFLLAGVAGVADCHPGRLRLR